MKEPIELPNLLDVQTDSFDWLIGNERWKKKVEEDKKNGTSYVPRVSGLEEVFEDISPIENYAKTMRLEFHNPHLEEPKHTWEECKEEGYTYSAPLFVQADFCKTDTEETKTQTVFMGNFPLQTPRGTFIIAGAERVVVSQLVRSPGVYFDRGSIPDSEKDKEIFSGRIIPSRGAWLEFEINKAGKLDIRVDRRKKVPVIVFLQAMGMSIEEIEEEFRDCETVRKLIKEQEIQGDAEEARNGALKKIAQLVRPNDTPSAENGKILLDSFYFNHRRYDLARVGRHKINQKLGLSIDPEMRWLRKEDIIASLRYISALAAGEKTMMGIKDGEAVEIPVEVDDIDNFANRHIRQVGELIQNQIRSGLNRMEKVIRERMATQDASSITPTSLLNVRPISTTIKEFFGTSQLSQFMDQNNPLAGITNKRRLSALGPGGLTRDRAGMEVRDVHSSHYGRMCPIESPEGPNIGLIGSLATFAKIDTYGFIEAPYRRVISRKVTDDITYMTADQEEHHVIAQASQKLDKENRIETPTALARDGKEEAVDVPSDEVDYMDVSPREMVSIGSSLIPFLEHDEGHRALMGANMQRQAVPLIKPDAPLVGTGSEWRTAYDSGDCVIAKEGGTVSYVSADTVKVLQDDNSEEVYTLEKFKRSNQTTCYNQKPIVSVGDRVEKGSVIANGPAIEQGELALGKNLIIAFMPWNGYNYEDATIISQRLVKDDSLSSIHIEGYEIDARDTKLGPEEITRDLPNCSDEMLANLDENGIVRIGAKVKAGDILVGKVTPKGETELNPEERLLRAIFGEKSREVRDVSLRLPHGESGTVISIKEITRENASEDGEEIPSGVNRIIKVFVAQHRKISVGDKLSGRHGNKCTVARILPEEDMPFLADGTPVDIMLNPLSVPSRMNLGQILELHLGWIAKTGWDADLDPGNYKWKLAIPEQALKGEPGTLVASPVFDGVKDDVLDGLLKTSLPGPDGERLVDSSGKAVLYDGRTGEPFPKPISVGIMYMLKLHHLVDDKIHTRATGPYSMITQQPLGGKAQFGGQRFGEMEVWALEAYGAAYTLHELMTVKSDDMDGRVKAYGAIVKGENLIAGGIPESFKVLLKEMQSLALNVEVLNSSGDPIDLSKESGDKPASGMQTLGINLSARPEKPLFESLDL
ncbi:MAG: DNA-directed RNA polymerase subunit beta [Aeriscardovia sp.]|nr:DNA-directed RNA polymerase subunit beta [Aeriscardovia sp.]